MSTNESLNLYADVVKISSKYVSLVTARDHTQNTLNLTIATKNKLAEMRMNLESIPVLDMIHLHKQNGEVIYSDLLKATLKVSRLQSTKSKIENQLRQEKVENKAYQQQNKKIRGDQLAADSEENKGEENKKFLNEKENTIQLLKKEMKIPTTQLIQSSEMEKEKETLNDELSNCK